MSTLVGMDIVIMNWSIWLVMTHLTFSQVEPKWYSWSRWTVGYSQMEHLVKLDK
jgi:hypothetical protein